MNADHAMPMCSAAGFTDITPATPLVLAGYAGRTAPFDGIADQLEANAVVLQDGGTPLVLITFDLLYVGDMLRNALEAALRSHVVPERLFLAASHTHFAPATDPTLPKLGSVANEYVQMIVERVARLVLDLLRGEHEPLTAGIAHAAVELAVNRRSVGWRIGRRFPFLHKGVWMRPNPAGPKDETVGVIRLGTRAVVWKYACHPVFVPQMNHVSADFIGQVRSALRARFGADLTVLFCQGFSGDIYPSFASTMIGPAARIRRLLFRAPDTVDSTVWRRWCDRLANLVVKAVDSVAPTDLHGPLHAVRSNIRLRDLLGPDAPDKRISVHRLQIGPDIQVFAISAEMVCEHLASVRAQFQGKDVFCVSCSDGVFGYLPTSRMVMEGGYEADGFFPYFSLQGKFPADIERFVRERFLT